MPEEDDFGRKGHRLLHNFGFRHRAKFTVNEANLMAVINQRPADRKQPQGRQMIGNATADGGVMNIDQ